MFVVTGDVLNFSTNRDFKRHFCREEELYSYREITRIVHRKVSLKHHLFEIEQAKLEGELQTLLQI